MKSTLHSSSIPPWELPGVRAALRDAQETAQHAQRLSQPRLNRALVAFCTFAAPPILILAGHAIRGAEPVAYWLSACGCLFIGLALALRLEPLPTPRVFETRGSDEEIDVRNLFDESTATELATLDLPGIAVGMSRPEVLEQLAKLRERGDLSGNEYLRACEDLDRV